MQNKLIMAAAHEAQLQQVGQLQDTQLADLQGRLAAELEKVESMKFFREGMDLADQRVAAAAADADRRTAEKHVLSQQVVAAALALQAVKLEKETGLRAAATRTSDAAGRTRLTREADLVNETSQLRALKETELQEAKGAVRTNAPTEGRRDSSAGGDRGSHCQRQRDRAPGSDGQTGTGGPEGSSNQRGR